MTTQSDFTSHAAGTALVLPGPSADASALSMGCLLDLIGGTLRSHHSCVTPASQFLPRDVVVDSRRARRGSVFWALRGPHRDGAEFADDAFRRGAVGIVHGNRHVGLPAGRWAIQVEDTRAGLAALTSEVRNRFRGALVAVTGSVGKTTTREMIHCILGSKLTGTASPANYNNEIGLPLSLLRSTPSDDYCVVEMAARGANEIEPLARLSRPGIGVVTRIADAHLGRFGDLRGVAAAKLELLACLPSTGTAVLNGDDPSLRRQATALPCNVRWFGQHIESDCRATDVRFEAGRLRFKVDDQAFSIPVWGRHFVVCALAAIEVGRLMGIDDCAIAQALRSFRMPPRRCQVHVTGGVTVIDDTYNASPTALTAALELLRECGAAHRRIAVLGDMHDLGIHSAFFHQQAGEQVVTTAGASLLFAVGEQAELVAEGARKSGLPAARTIVCRSVDQAVDRLFHELRTGDVLLVKGSRATGMDQVADAVVGSFSSAKQASSHGTFDGAAHDVMHDAAALGRSSHRQIIKQAEALSIALGSRDLDATHPPG